jgi:heme-degrading monooxygenase HmoA
MIAVIFEVIPTKEGFKEYLEIAKNLREYLNDIPGFISIERFQSIVNPDKLLSLSFWENEEAVKQWRNLPKHRFAQGKGMNELFMEYSIRVGGIIRDYTINKRNEAPIDSNQVHKK